MFEAIRHSKVRFTVRLKARDNNPQRCFFFGHNAGLPKKKKSANQRIEN
jgi:hypothetical protein